MNAKVRGHFRRIHGGTHSQKKEYTLVVFARENRYTVGTIVFIIVCVYKRAQAA